MLMPDIDIFLWNRIKTGDEEAFRIVFDKYYSLLCLLSKQYTHNINTSREIVQALFVNLWEKKNALDITTLKGYLCQSVRFNTIRHLENDRKMAIRLESLPQPDHESVSADHLEFAELEEAIIRTIDCLPEQCSRVFKMSRFERLTYTEIADKLEISVKTVESHISKALKTLTEKLKGY